VAEISANLKQNAAQILSRVRNTSPLVHNITNFVVMNSSANILLAVGASPVMAHSLSEVEEMTGIAGALVLNIGTLEGKWVDAMILAGKTANKKGIPIILDPVGSGATAFRTESVKRILHACRVSVLRGNGSEIFSLQGTEAGARGVDSQLAFGDTHVGAAKQLAHELGCVVAISGKTDCITDGQSVYRVSNGHPMMTRVTGLGCGLSAVTAAFCAVAENTSLPVMARHTAAAFGFYGVCGERAARQTTGPGSFEVAFVDALFAAGSAEIEEMFKAQEMVRDA
jgi:hydroxyethylthiazole kinase